MSFSDDLRDAKQRFPEHIRAFEVLFRQFDITSVATAWQAMSSSEFRMQFTSLAEKVMSVEGGKLTFATMFAIIGAALGGVGIAMMGGAVGVPLALIGAMVGLVLGNEADQEGYTSTFIRKLKAFYNG